MLDNRLIKVDPAQLSCARQTVCMILLDSSGSMEEYVPVMKDALRNFKSILVSTGVSDEIIVNVLPFAEEVEYDKSEFTSVENMATEYCADGGTALFDAIVEGRRMLNNYLEELRNTGISAKGIFVIFSDGHDEHSMHNDCVNAIRAIERMQENDGHIVAFVAFGEDAKIIANDLHIRKENIWCERPDANTLSSCFELISSSVATVSKRANFTENEGSGIFFDLEG